jgi:1,4-dihydroxy-2-naphthoate octaprenyltransferase
VTTKAPHPAESATTPRSSQASAWFSTLRIRTLPAAAVPVVVGAAHAWHSVHADGVVWSLTPHAGFNALAAVAALVSALFIQIGTNLANDYYDHKKGADTPDRAGPTRASASGLIDPRKVRNAAFGAFAAAMLLGAYLVVVGGWPVLVIGLASVAAGLLYTAGPRPLAYNGLGDIFVLVFFGPVAVMGTTYVIDPSRFDEIAIWMPALFVGISLGCLATAILVVNNLRDAPTDAQVGKKTLAVRWGDQAMRIEYSLLLWLAFYLAFAAFSRHHQPRLLLPLAALPLTIVPLRKIWGDLSDRRRLNAALGQTAMVLLAYGLLEAVALYLP